MIKSVFFLLLLSINCSAVKPMNCYNIDPKLNNTIIKMVKNICNSDNLNKNIRFIFDVNDVQLDEWITKGYFVIIDKKSNIVLFSYNQIFKQIALLADSSIFNSRDLITSSLSNKLPNYNWLKKINQVYALISTDVDKINAMYKEKTRNPIEKISSISSVNTSNDKSLIPYLAKISTCNAIDPTLNLEIISMINYICNSDNLNKNIRFIADSINIDVDKWIKAGYFIIILKEFNIVVLPYNNIFKQIAILPTAADAGYYKFIKDSSLSPPLASDWFDKVNNVSSLVTNTVYNVNNMFSGKIPVTLPTKFPTIHIPTNINTDISSDYSFISKFQYSLIGILSVSGFCLTVIVLYKYIFKNKRRNYISI